jgi:hypothetical protein
MGLHVSESLLRLVAGPRLEDGGGGIRLEEALDVLRRDEKRDAVFERHSTILELDPVPPRTILRGSALGLGHNYYDSDAGRICAMDYRHPLGLDSGRLALEPFLIDQRAIGRLLSLR